MLSLQTHKVLVTVNTEIIPCIHVHILEVKQANPTSSPIAQAQGMAHSKPASANTQHVRSDVTASNSK